MDAVPYRRLWWRLRRGDADIAARKADPTKSTPAAIGCGGASVSINLHPCHSEPVTDVTGVGIRNLLAGNLRKSAGIMRFGNGLPRQCEHWLAMTGFFDRLKHPRSRSCGVILRIRYWMEMELLLGSCFFAFLGTETVRMPSSNLAETSSGSTASPT